MSCSRRGYSSNVAIKVIPGRLGYVAATPRKEVQDNGEGALGFDAPPESMPSFSGEASLLASLVAEGNFLNEQLGLTPFGAAIAEEAQLYGRKAGCPR